MTTLADLEQRNATQADTIGRKNREICRLRRLNDDYRERLQKGQAYVERLHTKIKQHDPDAIRKGVIDEIFGEVEDHE